MYGSFHLHYIYFLFLNKGEKMWFVLNSSVFKVQSSKSETVFESLFLCAGECDGLSVLAAADLTELPSFAGASVSPPLIPSSNRWPHHCGCEPTFKQQDWTGGLSVLEWNNRSVWHCLCVLGGPRQSESHAQARDGVVLLQPGPHR